MSALLEIENLSAGYGKKVIVNNVSFQVGAGKLCALLGLNGSGKTTLLKSILGLLPLASGNCFVDGHNITKLSEYKRARFISYIPQRHSRLQGVSVLDVVMMGFYSILKPLEFPTAKNKELALATLEKLGYGHLYDDDFSKISEGQKQMVILARTLVQNTSVMLMDEPDSALDFSNRRLMLEEVSKLVRDRGKAGLVTLHDPSLAMAYCDHLFLLKGGTILSELDLTAASKEDIKMSLSQIYKNVSILEHEGRYIVV